MEKCECGKELTYQEKQAEYNKKYDIKLCADCMDRFAHHAITGE